MRKERSAEAGKAGKARRGVERVKQPELQGPAQWTDHPKRIEVGSATQARQMVGANMIAHTNLLTPSWVPREDATLYRHVQRQHGVGAPSSKATSPASRACCACSTPPSSGRVIYDKNENIAETSEKNVQSEDTIYTVHTQGVTLEFPATNSMYPTFRGLFSARDPRFVHLSMS